MPERSGDKEIHGESARDHALHVIRGAVRAGGRAGFESRLAEAGDASESMRRAVATEVSREDLMDALTECGALQGEANATFKLATLWCAEFDEVERALQMREHVSQVELHKIDRSIVDAFVRVNVLELERSEIGPTG